MPAYSTIIVKLQSRITTPRSLLLLYMLYTDRVYIPNLEKKVWYIICGIGTCMILYYYYVVHRHYATDVTAKIRNKQTPYDEVFLVFLSKSKTYPTTLRALLRRRTALQFRPKAIAKAEDENFDCLNYQIILIIKHYRSAYGSHSIPVITLEYNRFELLIPNHSDGM